MDSYAVVSRFYDVLEPFLRHLRKQSLDLLKSVLPPRDDILILDAGCGTGSQSGMFAGSGYPVVAVDLSWPMLERTNAKRKRPGRARFDAVRCSIDCLPFASGVFDGVVIQLALHEMTAAMRDRCTAELKRVAQKDAFFLVADFLSTDQFTLMDLVIAFAELSAGRRHFRNGRAFIRKGGLSFHLSRFDLQVITLCRFLRGRLGLALARAFDSDQSLVEHGPHHLDKRGDVGAV